MALIEDLVAVLNRDDTKVDGDDAVGRSELDAVREEVENDLTVASLVTEDFEEVVFLDGVGEDGADQVDVSKRALSHHRIDALLDEADAVEVLVDHRKRVVRHLRLVEQVSHQARHHFDLALHVHELLREVCMAAQLPLHYVNEQLSLVQNHDDLVAQLLLLRPQLTESYRTDLADGR